MIKTGNVEDRPWIERPTFFSSLPTSTVPTIWAATAIRLSKPRASMGSRKREPALTISMSPRRSACPIAYARKDREPRSQAVLAALFRHCWRREKERFPLAHLQPPHPRGGPLRPVGRSAPRRPGGSCIRDPATPASHALRVITEQRQPERKEAPFVACLRG